MARDDGGAGTVIVAFVLGAVAGAAVALLTAPTSGEEARRALAERAREGRERASDAARQGRDLVNRGKETMTGAIERGKGTVTTAIERGREAYQQARGGAAAPAPGGDTL
ncbi:MAG: YtxH domain-containing protein [Acidobacteriota bacterium]